MSLNPRILEFFDDIVHLADHGMSRIDRWLAKLQCKIDGHLPATNMVIRAYPELVTEKRCGRCGARLGD